MWLGCAAPHVRIHAVCLGNNLASTRLWPAGRITTRALTEWLLTRLGNPQFAPTLACPACRTPWEGADVLARTITNLPVRMACSPRTPARNRPNGTYVDHPRPDTAAVICGLTYDEMEWGAAQVPGPSGQRAWRGMYTCTGAHPCHGGHVANTPMTGLRALWTRRVPHVDVFPFCSLCDRRVHPVIIHDPGATPQWIEGWNCRGGRCGVRPHRDGGFRGKCGQHRSGRRPSVG